MITYKQAFDKITEAYFKDKIRPMDNGFCFCGTLSGGAAWWEGDKNYTKQDYKNMEWALLRRLIGIYTELLFVPKSEGFIHYGFQWGWLETDIEPQTKEYEDALFRGLCDALDVLKKIHIERGENIDNIQFEKRELINV